MHANSTSITETNFVTVKRPQNYNDPLLTSAAAIDRDMRLCVSTSKSERTLAVGMESARLAGTSAALVERRWRRHRKDPGC